MMQRNRLEKPVRDSGHKRVPEPPQGMTGVTWIMLVVFCLDWGLLLQS